MALSKQGLPSDMKLIYHMDGNVNGHSFVIKGEGEGKPYEGTHTIKLQVVEGGPLPFSVDILSTVFQYGNRCFTKYPPNIVDYFKNSCPPGYTFERSFLYEDGAVCTASGDITLSLDKDRKYYFDHKSKFFGINFPADGPVMKKATTNWEPSCEKMTCSPGEKTLKGDVIEFLLLEDGGRYKCLFHTVYQAKNPQNDMPDFHFVQHKLTRKHIRDPMQTWQLTEHAAACGSCF
ncbi:GFP-like fluorescent chromoprotein FP506 [Montipora capricornis]|uniref:GFP-like fluorescent chromoprotein FP506 n=1 Tax=Montipora capricornis TaxID=246305 RepID=UPI0035F1E580